jgi:hypothetical protein
MVGYAMEDAKHDLAQGKKATRIKPKKPTKTNAEDVESGAQEEWTGIDA